MGQDRALVAAGTTTTSLPTLHRLPLFPPRYAPYTAVHACCIHNLKHPLMLTRHLFPLSVSACFPPPLYHSSPDSMRSFLAVWRLKLAARSAAATDRGASPSCGREGHGLRCLQVRGTHKY
eukprot:scaffold45432_cov22-Tisochrysis_lutea.AAC.2